MYKKDWPLCPWKQQQQLIELIRENRIEDALKFASEQLAERGEEDASVLNELERTLALLAFEDPHISPFSDLLSHSHRQKVNTPNFIRPSFGSVLST